MQSLFKLLVVIYGILFLVAITSAYELKKSRNRRCTQIPKVVTVQQVTEPVDHIAEGPHWENESEKLYFVDIEGQKIYRLNPKTGELNSIYISEGPVGLAIPVKDSPDKLVAGVGTDIALITWDGERNSTSDSTNIEVLATVDSDRNGTRFNDGKVDSQGRLWAGTMGPEDDSGVTPDLGSLYLIKDDLIPRRVISPVSISNGLAWNTEDDTFYFIDTPTKQIAAYDFDPNSGNISNKRIVFDLRNTDLPGSPDGMTIDTNGNLWIALFGGGQVINVDPKAKRLLQSIEIPANRVTSVIFGGPSLDILYVTTSRLGLNEAELKAQPRAGSVFAIKGLGVQGSNGNSFVLRRNMSS